MALSREGCAQDESLPHNRGSITATSLHRVQALSENACSIASQRFETAMYQPRSVPLAGQLLRHLRGAGRGGF